MTRENVPAVDIKQDARSQSDIWCWAALIVVLIAAAVIRGRLLSIPFERDEGEYAYIAQQMLQGAPPYESAYSMKLPGIYVVYSLIMAVFGQTQTAVHLGLLIVNVLTIIVIFLLAKNLFGPLAAVASGCAYAITSLAAQVNGLMANAEHFVVLPAMAGLLLVYKPNNKKGYVSLFIAGLLLGLAFIIKQHGIFFAILAALYLFYSDLRCRPIQWNKLVITQIVLTVGAVLPFGMVCLYFWHRGSFDKFWFWTFTYAGKYTTSVPLTDAWEILKEHSGLVVKEAGFIWLIALLGLAAVIVIKRYRKALVFTVGLLIFSFLAVCPGLYFRGHYFIIFLPAVAVLAGAGLAAIDILSYKIPYVLLRVILTGIIGLAVAGYSLYQQRVCLFEDSPEEVSRLMYGANPFPESLKIAEYIRDNSRPDDTVAILGSEPQIYFYSRRRSATHFIYTYPLFEEQPYAAKMQQEMIDEIEAAKPEFMVFIKVTTSWLVMPDSPEDIFNWSNPYVNNFYNLVGIIDIPSHGPANYYWDGQAAGHKPKSEYWVGVFKRRQ